MTGTLGRMAIAALALCCAADSRGSAQEHAVAPDAGCVQEHGQYTCNWSSFRLALERARTVGVATDPIDRPTARQLNELVGEMGKAHAVEGQTADLTLLLIPIPPTGVNFGPGSHDLATLRVYAPSDGFARGTLLWAETYRGEGDRPWPAQVHALITQFESRLPRR